MNDGTLQVAQTEPLVRPQPAPTARASAADGPSGQPQRVMAIPSIEPESASTEPTDRSIPPAMTTTVMPTATTTRSGTWLMTIWRVCQVQKLRLARPKTPTSARSTSSRPRLSPNPARRGRIRVGRGRVGGVVSAMDVVRPRCGCFSRFIGPPFCALGHGPEAGWHLTVPAGRLSGSTKVEQKGGPPVPIQNLHIENYRGFGRFEMSDLGRI